MQMVSESIWIFCHFVRVRERAEERTNLQTKEATRRNITNRIQAATFVNYDQKVMNIAFYLSG